MKLEFLEMLQNKTVPRLPLFTPSSVLERHPYDVEAAAACAMSSDFQEVQTILKGRNPNVVKMDATEEHRGLQWE
jgi:hypothetical protein